MGTSPPTALLLTRNDIVVGRFSSWSAMTIYLGISVDMETGVVSLTGKPQQPTYVVTDDGGDNHWKTEMDVIKDWSSKHLKLPSGYAVYRYLT